MEWWPFRYKSSTVLIRGPEECLCKLENFHTTILNTVRTQRNFLDMNKKVKIFFWV